MKLFLRSGFVHGFPVVPQGLLEHLVSLRPLRSFLCGVGGPFHQSVMQQCDAFVCRSVNSITFSAPRALAFARSSRQSRAPQVEVSRDAVQYLLPFFGGGKTVGISE